MSESKNSASGWASDVDESVWSKLISSPILWGGVATAGFYGAIPYSPIWRAEITRYFAGHWIEYVTSLLAFIGLAILAKKALRLRSEGNAARWSGWIGDEPIPTHDLQAATKILARNIQIAPDSWRATHLARRVREVIGFLNARRSASGLDDHLKYIAELAAGDLHSSYSLVRTVTWAVPILGFLGTVVGITDAIANLTPEQLEQSLSGVTAGLGTAFDTTALSLGWSMVIVFTTFFVERKEQAILAAVEDFGTRRLAPLFAESDAPGGALFAAEAEAAEMLLRRTDEVINLQMQSWQDSVETARQRWAVSLERHQQQLDEALRAGLFDTLQHHATQLAESRSRETQLATFDNTVRSWQDGMIGVQSMLQSLVGELRTQGELLLKITDQEAGLHGLQEQLATNLTVVRQSAAFEETLHTLNAAVHLLTNRVQARAA